MLIHNVCLYIGNGLSYHELFFAAAIYLLDSPTAIIAHHRGADCCFSRSILIDKEAILGPFHHRFPRTDIPTSDHNLEVWQCRRRHARQQRWQKREMCDSLTL